jgi:hypothetical protein
LFASDDAMIQLALDSVTVNVVFVLLVRNFSGVKKKYISVIPIKAIPNLKIILD